MLPPQETHLPLTGFIGLGTMGEPMAFNLARAGVPLVVWNRTPGKTSRLCAAGAQEAGSVQEIFDRTGVVFLMLTDGPAIDAVLARSSAAFSGRVSGHTLINMATVAPQYSQELAEDIRRMGGSYVEAPVSGSRKPAEDGKLLGLLAGEAADIEPVRPLFAPLCRATLLCGAVPNALRMKLANNLLLASLVTALAEAFAFARQSGLNLQQFSEILLNGQMANDIFRFKIPLLVENRFPPQASLKNAVKDVRLVNEAAAQVGMDTPLSGAVLALFEEALANGFGEEDVTAVQKMLLDAHNSQE